MKEVAIMYVKIIIFIFIPILAAVTIAGLLIGMIQSEAIQLIVTVITGIILGLPTILYIHWVGNKIDF